ncbi:MAG TPA: aminopeptidase [Syntrophomonadaceae bacterium]|nr:aminopeptidase [Syntrophomonadaceae bacterium]
MAENKEELKRNAWKRMDQTDTEAAHNMGRAYMDFLNRARTEREAVECIVQLAEEKGFTALQDNTVLSPGQKLVIADKDKVCALVIVGQQPLEKGINLVASHIDAPRLDLKARPLYEADGMALFKTHYYGGIKKYQWVGIPLAMHGVVVKKDGKQIRFRIGDDPNDLAFTIADLLPHLAKDQMEKKMSEAIKGEDLNVLVGSQPQAEADTDAIKNQIILLLKDKYGIDEEDFTSAEVEVVPAFLAREIGFDRSMIGSYGQDDRVSAYTSLKAILEVEKPQRTACCLFVDKEEIGSTGNTGLQSLLIENLMAELMHRSGQHDYYTIRKALANSSALSADVNAAVDPNYPEVFEKMNCSFLSQGVVVTKFTGSRGKSDSNDANPEFLARIRQLLDQNQVVWQVGELGKVDIGGGGTVAQYMARYGMEVVDCGVALLGMHSPFEVASKADIYMAYKAYKAFFQDF